MSDKETELFEEWFRKNRCQCCCDDGLQAAWLKRAEIAKQDKKQEREAVLDEALGIMSKYEKVYSNTITGVELLYAMQEIKQLKEGEK